MDRRSFLRNAAGLFVAAAAAPIVEPARRIWQVGAQLERPRLSGAAVAMQLEHERALRVGESVLTYTPSHDDWITRVSPSVWADLNAALDKLRAYDEPVRLVGEHGAVELPTDTLFGISAEPFDWGKPEPLTWEKLQEGIGEWHRRSSIPQEPQTVLLTPQEWDFWQRWTPTAES